MTDAEIAETPVVILAGGRGARFDHESQVKPKPLIEVAGKPMLGHIMDLFEAQGFKKFIILGGYLCDQINDYVATRYECRATPPGYDHITAFGNRGQKVLTHVFDTGVDATTGDRLMALALDFMLGQTVILTYGDGLADVNMRELLEHHETMKKRTDRDLPFVTLTAVQPPGRFGVLRFNDGYHLEDNDFVEGFEEKHSREWVNGGFMVVDAGAVLMYAPDSMDDLDGPCKPFESGALPRMAKNHRLAAYRHHGYWRCMDTRRDLELIEEDIRRANGLLPWRRDMMWPTEKEEQK